jgi:hypothetical protein
MLQAYGSKSSKGDYTKGLCIAAIEIVCRILLGEDSREARD